MSREQDMVEEFHAAMSIPIGDRAAPSIAQPGLRYALIAEELEELRLAMDAGDLVAAADALADLMYVVLGTAVQFGIDLAPVFDEVHASNLRKVGGTKREDGKQLKPAGWKPPDVAGVLERQIASRRPARSEQ
jgi:predicted HAD superfamily Cof-like phosphohydrolase